MTTLRTTLIMRHQLAFEQAKRDELGHIAAKEHALMVKARRSTQPFTNPEILALAYAVNAYADAMAGIRSRAANVRLVLKAHDGLAVAA